MNMIFIRHGQGEHTLNPPESLKIVDPSLTSKGIDQSNRLIDRFPITTDDIIIVSPTRSTFKQLYIGIMSESLNLLYTMQ